MNKLHIETKMKENINIPISGQELIDIGYPEGKVIGIVLKSIPKLLFHFSEEETLIKLKNVLTEPEKYMNDEFLATIAEALIPPKETTIALNNTPDSYKIYGTKHIENGAINQMDIAMRLPITKAGALMPDAHHGYGLPIGGVLATENAVIPYGVGMDIGCRMCMSIFDIPSTLIEEENEHFKKLLHLNTKFGKATFKKPIEHEVLESSLFKEIKLLNDLKDKAASQIGTSGGGNHFVEFGITEIVDEHNEYNLAPGKYLALLSHSGSRGLGAAIASYYTKLAMMQTPLPKEARHLAWLGLETEVGQEYWEAMSLAGAYASANHHQIHERIAIGLRTSPLAMIENHHNFAWKEQDANGNELIVHRKGATPAGKGTMGIIPGSMTAPGFIVRGKGERASINSASHGAGRAMSRTQAKNTLDKNKVLSHLQSVGVDVIGSGLDEAPMAYKNIHQVMESQKDLVEIVGTFQPKIVRMCGDEKFQEKD